MSNQPATKTIDKVIYIVAIATIYPNQKDSAPYSTVAKYDSKADARVAALDFVSENMSTETKVLLWDHYYNCYSLLSPSGVIMHVHTERFVLSVAVVAE